MGPEYKGKGEIFLPPGTSTRARLHEIAHRELGHEPGRYSARELVGDELDAEIWAWERIDKELTPRVGIPAMGAILEYFPKSSNGEVLDIVTDGLRKRGIKVTKAGEGDLEHFLENFNLIID